MKTALAMMEPPEHPTGNDWREIPLWGLEIIFQLEGKNWAGKYVSHKFHPVDKAFLQINWKDGRTEWLYRWEAELLIYMPREDRAWVARRVQEGKRTW